MELKRILVLLLLVVIQALCISGTEADKMLTNEIKQCLRIIKTIKLKYLSIIKGQISKDIKSEEPINPDHSGLPTLDSLLEYNWVWDVSPDKVVDVSKISFSTIDGLARTGMFLLEKCIDVDINNTEQGSLCEKAGNETYDSFSIIALEFKNFKKEKNAKKVS